MLQQQDTQGLHLVQLEEYKKLKAATLATRKQSVRPSASPTASTGSTAVQSVQPVSQPAEPRSQPDAAELAADESEPAEATVSLRTTVSEVRE